VPLKKRLAPKGTARKIRVKPEAAAVAVDGIKKTLIRTSAVITDNPVERRAKLNRRAAEIRNVTQLNDILSSFPPELRAELLEEIRPSLRFEVA
jgi:hypothetical protein